MSSIAKMRWSSIQFVRDEHFVSLPLLTSFRPPQYTSSSLVPSYIEATSLRPSRGQPPS